MIRVVQEKIGMRIMRHAGRAHVEDGDDEVEAAGHRGDAEDLQASTQKSTLRPGLSHGTFAVSGA